MRIDQEEYLTKIDDQIIAEIRRSKFLVADLTERSKGARGSVHYCLATAFFSIGDT